MVLLGGKDDFRTRGKHILRKDARQICGDPIPAPSADENGPQTARACRHAVPFQPSSPYALRDEGAPYPRAPLAGIGFGGNHMGIRELVATTVSQERRGSLNTRTKRHEAHIRLPRDIGTAKISGRSFSRHNLGNGRQLRRGRH